MEKCKKVHPTVILYHERGASRSLQWQFLNLKLFIETKATNCWNVSHFGLMMAKYEQHHELFKYKPIAEPQNLVVVS